MKIDWSKLKRIETLEELIMFAEKRRAVVSPNIIWAWKPVPAAFVVAMQGRIIQSALKTGLYLYVKPDKPEKKNRHPIDGLGGGATSEKKEYSDGS